MKPNWYFRDGIGKSVMNRLGLGLLALMLVSLLAACGDATATLPASTVNPFNAPITPQPTPSSTATVGSVPSLTYAGAKVFTVSDASVKGTLSNIGAAGSLVGKFNGDTATFATTADSKDKVEEFYRKLMISQGWSAVARQADDTTTVLVYQKDITKLVISISQITDVSKFPEDFKNNLKQGETLILTAQGRAVEPPATPVVIPGSPTLTVGAGQKKIATIELEKGGTIVAELYPELAPKTVENFEKLANSNFYNGLTFHRVEPNFVVQGGDPKGDGTGGPGYTIPGEFAENGLQIPANLQSEAKHVYGSLAMARATDPNSAGSQFYIVTGQENDPSVAGLNGKYAVFGKVTQGMDLVKQIAKGDKIKSIKVTVQ